MQRPIIEIDESKCDGCGQCVLACAEGALTIVDGKAKLVSESYCDGLGACLHCPQNALTIVSRDAPAFDEKAAIAAKSQSSFKAKSTDIQHSSCQSINMAPRGTSLRVGLSSWPIQLRLIPATAPFLKHSHVLLAAHCAGFVLPNVQQDWIQGRIPIIACPKLEPWAELVNRFSEILQHGEIASLDILRMSVPCCGGLERLATHAMQNCRSTIGTRIHIVPTP